MTCKQARQLLAAYRRHDLSPDENAELHAHLSECADCQARAAEYRSVGEALQSLPTLAPPPDFYARVMAAVRVEDEQAAERSQAAARKKPETVVIPGLTDISYLPSVRRAVAQRRARVTPLRSQMSPAGAFAVRYGAGLAALFMIFAFGVSTALVLLHLSPIGGPTGPTGECVITHTCGGFYTSVFNPDPLYPFVADATASPEGQYIIYAAHNAKGQWMLEELDRQSQESTALLSAPVVDPLTLDGWARSWVLWGLGGQGAGKQWQLNATELSPALPGAAQTVHLLQGNKASPEGKVAALHGITTLGSTVLLAEELTDGRGQLVSLDLTSQGDTVPSVIPTEQEPDHLITDPAIAQTTSTFGGLTYYWVDQWQDPDGTLHGNIWRLLPGGLPEQVTTNDVSFSPMVASGKLFWLEEPLPQSANAASNQSAPSPTATATSANGNAAESQVSGIIWSETPDGRPDLDTAPKTNITGTGSLVSTPQAGETFIVWEVKKGDYSLYDVPNNSGTSLNAPVNNPLTLSVSPTAVLWVTSNTPNGSQITPTRTTINLMDWPQPQN